MKNMEQEVERVMNEFRGKRDQEDTDIAKGEKVKVSIQVTESLVIHVTCKPNKKG